MSSYLRRVTVVSLIAFAGLIGIGIPALLISTGNRMVARAENSDPPATPCDQENWLQFDRKCMSRRSLPWISGRGISNVVEVAAAANSAPEPPLTESQHATGVPKEATLQETVLQAPETKQQVPQEPAQLEAFPQSNIEGSVPGTSVPPPAGVQIPAAKQRPVAKRTLEVQARLPALKKVTRRDQATKPSTNDVSNEARKFGDNLHNIPVSSFAADGAQRTIVIRPTSIQDAYYYSAPR